ncbi:alpha/beta hydrolase [Deinococcus gobiensis]|uniref:alpha/beta hydrolase n=1 Tax=Deinococcus gobiensis TaxID=502394 RepID=UPI0003068844|nr:alpha/beta hydrolase [Deinococcus gobiensis]
MAPSSVSRPRRAAPGRLLALGLGALAAAALLASCSGARLESAALGLVNSTNSPRGLKVVRDQPYGPDPRNRLDVYAPPSARNVPTVLFVHGGSWQGGDKADYQFVGESLARAGYVTGVMSYRLAPQNRYPTYVQDVAAALKWLRDNAQVYGGRPDDLFVTGHSAGAFNAVEAVDNARWLAEAGVPVSAVRGVIGIAGPYSYDFREFPSRVAFPEGATPDEVMPDRHVRPDAPPHLLLVAANDTTVYPQNALNMEAALRKAGIPVTRTVLPGLNHVTIIGAAARNLTFLGATREQMIAFIEARRLR